MNERGSVSICVCVCVCMKRERERERERVCNVIHDQLGYAVMILIIVLTAAD